MGQVIIAGKSKEVIPHCIHLSRFFISSYRYTVYIIHEKLIVGKNSSSVSAEFSCAELCFIHRED